MTEVLFIVSFSFYFARALFFVLGSKKGRIKFKEIYIEKYPFVSIIVPARDEQDNIIMCLESIIESEYPRDKYEIIVVNDRSTDSTQELVSNFAKKYENIKLLHISEDSQKVVAGKPGALDYGINNAIGEFILLTDADCKVNKKWVSSMVKTFIEKDSDLIAAFTLVKHDNFFDKYQAIEWILMHTMASGGMGLNFPLGCFGNNMAFKKSVYNQLGGYKKIEFSVTEDLALLQSVHKIGGKINYICHRDSTVKTLPLNSIKDYLKQRKRWAIGGKMLGWKATLFVLASLLIWITAIISFVEGHYYLSVAIMLLKIITDAILVIPTIYTVKEKGLLLYLIPSNFLFIIMELILPFLIINKKVVWKGQTFN
jgi:cellulose synthase/poly-beta-1,6-N-acetylglucosamine synthase-like glycosyltransferase